MDNYGADCNLGLEKLNFGFSLKLRKKKYSLSVGNRKTASSVNAGIYVYDFISRLEKSD